MNVKIITAALCLLVAPGVRAQDIASVKKLLLLAAYRDAKVQIDKITANPDFASKPEAWLLKATVYAVNYQAVKNPGLTKEDSAAYLAEAAQALNKYTQLEPAGTLLMNDYYQKTPVPIYAGYFNTGIGKYNIKEWEAAFTNLQVAAQLSDHLVKIKVLPGPIDTNAILYTAAAAQNAKKDEEAVYWYGKLADFKVAGAAHEFWYQYVTDYYLRKKDAANFKKYQQLGVAFYPNSSYFREVAKDFVRTNGSINDVVMFYEDKIRATPGSYELHYDLGAEIFDYLKDKKDAAETTGGGFAALEQRMIEAFTKAAELVPNRGMPLAVIGSSYAKKAEKINGQIVAVNAGIKNATGTATDLKAKKEQLYADYYIYIDKAATYYSEACNRFSKQASLTTAETQFYKNAAANMIDISEMRMMNAKNKPAELAKYTKEKKEWEAVYDAIK